MISDENTWYTYEPYLQNTEFHNIGLIDMTFIITKEVFQYEDF